MWVGAMCLMHEVHKFACVYVLRCWKSYFGKYSISETLQRNGAFQLSLYLLIYQLTDCIVYSTATIQSLLSVQRSDSVKVMTYDLLANFCGHGLVAR